MEAGDVIPLDRAASMIHGLLPDADSSWRARIWDPDYLIGRARALGARVAVTFVRDWEGREDDELVRLLLGNTRFSDPKTIVVTDFCLGGSPPGVAEVNGAFQVDGCRIGEFVRAYRSQLSGHFVDGDVIVVSPSDRVIKVFHHEGAVFDIALSGQEEAPVE